MEKCLGELSEPVFISSSTVFPFLQCQSHSRHHALKRQLDAKTSVQSGAGKLTSAFANLPQELQEGTGKNGELLREPVEMLRHARDAAQNSKGFMTLFMIALLESGFVRKKKKKLEEGHSAVHEVVMPSQQ